MRSLIRGNKRLLDVITSFISYKSLSSTATSAQLKITFPTQEEPPLFFQRPTNVAFLHSFLQLCASLRDPKKGKACHAQAIHLGLEQDILTSNILINVYSKCGLVGSARNVFDRLLQRSLVSWNTLISAYTRNGNQKHKALLLFLELLGEGYPFSEFTISSVLCACVSDKDVLVCSQIHALAIKAALVDNSYVSTALLDVYAKSGWVDDARRVFDAMTERSGVAWSAMMAGFVDNELYEDVLLLFAHGGVMGLEFYEFTLSSAVCACAGLAALVEGKQLHAIVFKTGFGSNVFVGSSLVDMYAKCGSVKEGYMVFLDAQGKNVVLWNAMISALAKHSRTLEVMILFEKMQQVGFCPDEVTYVSVLSACSHMGLVDKGRKYFDLMVHEHNVSRNVLHYSCMVDILGRAGLTCEAYELLKTMQFDATAPIWGSLLSSCRTHGNLELAEVAARKLVELEPDNAGNYILLCHMYAANKQWEEAAMTWKFLQENELKKETGESWIEIKDMVHVFSVGERRHPRVTDIYLELDKLQEEMKKLGYKTDADFDGYELEGS